MSQSYRKEVLSSPNVASSSSPLSQGIRYGNLIFLSGQLGRNPETKQLENGFRVQVKRVMNNLKEILEASGSSMDMVLKTTIFITDLNNVKELNEVYQEFFNKPYPVRSCVEVSALALEAEVEIELIAACG